MRSWVITKKRARYSLHECCIVSNFSLKDTRRTREISIEPRIWRKKTLSDLRDQGMMVLAIGDSSPLYFSLSDANSSHTLKKEDKKMHLLKHRMDDLLESAKSMISSIKRLDSLCSNLSLP